MNLIAEGGKAMLAFDGERAGLPVFADLAKHRRNHADRDVDRSAACRDHLVNDRFCDLDVVAAPGDEQATEDIVEELRMRESAAFERQVVVGVAGCAQTMRDAQIVVFRCFAREALAI
ncbi:hypothetical protein [Bradyrhizobium sp. UFLA03-84]|uniref:hypothetical protein n=1 Tax=Bradyrhizobium sp. UFLA03-84 TaxID=418599 RepID=UPI001FDAC420|nr:hypothetical protein [Bradyrhizobium sp. UFLA03-84]